MTQPGQRVEQGHWLVVGLAGLALFVVGGYGQVVGRAMSERLPVRAADLEAGQPAPSRWLEVTGRLLRDERIIWDGEDLKETYVPLVSEAWKPGAPVLVFVRTTDEIWGEPGRLLYHEKPAVNGLVRSAGLPAEVARFFSEKECPPAANVLVLDFDTEPAPHVQVSRIAALVGGALVLFGGWMFWSSRQPRNVG